MVKNGAEKDESINKKEEKPIIYKDGKRVILESDESFSHIESFRKKYERGLQGKNKSLSMGLKRLNNYFGLRKQIMYCVSGYSGSGKTSFVDDAFVLNPIEYIEENLVKTNFHVIYFSMERSKDYKIAKWIARKIFLEKQRIIPLETILGWKTIATKEEQALIEAYFNYAEHLFSTYITIFENPTNPTGFWKEVKNFATSRGHYEEVIIRKKTGYEYTKKVYLPDDEDELIMVIIDTIQITKPEKKEGGQQMNPKETMDKALEYCRLFRDELGYSPVVVSQNNRDIADSMRLKMGDVEPRLEDLMGTSSLATDSEVVLALFDCSRYKVPDPYGYDLNKLRENVESGTGALKYRSISILKNSYGTENIGVGLAYQPQTGLICEMMPKKDMTDDIYNQIIDNSYFLMYKQ